MVESFSRIFEHEISLNSLPGIMFSKGIKSINHAQFVDGTILLGEASCFIERIFIFVLENFVLFSVIMINDGKIHLYSWNIRKVLRGSIFRIIGIVGRDIWTNFKYFGYTNLLQTIPSSILRPSD